MATQRLQSVIEYLSTYSWAILAAAVIVGIMFALGIFSNPIPIQSCILVPGYICSHPILTNQGLLTFNLSYVGQTITVTGIGCNSGNTPPATLQSANFVLTSNKGTSITVECPISSNAFGTAFQGHLWLQYNTQTQSNLVSDIGVILSAVNTQTSTSTTSTSTTSTSSTSSTSTSSTSSTSSSSTSSTSTSTTSTTSISPPVFNPTSGSYSGDIVYSVSTTLTGAVIGVNMITINSGVTVDECGNYLQGNAEIINRGIVTDTCSGGSGGGISASGNAGSTRTSKYFGQSLIAGHGGAGGGAGGGGGSGNSAGCSNCAGNGGSGGKGGGIVELYANVINNQGTISVSGFAGASGGGGGFCACNCPSGTSGAGGGGGGGSGGTVMIGYVTSVTFGTITVGAGSPGSGGPGGSGSGGGCCTSSGGAGAGGSGTSGGSGGNGGPTFDARCSSGPGPGAGGSGGTGYSPVTGSIIEMSGWTH